MFPDTFIITKTRVFVFDRATHRVTDGVRGGRVSNEMKLIYGETSMSEVLFNRARYATLRENARRT